MVAVGRSPDADAQAFDEERPVASRDFSICLDGLVAAVRERVGVLIENSDRVIGDAQRRNDGINKVRLVGRCGSFIIATITCVLLLLSWCGCGIDFMAFSRVWRWRLSLRNLSSQQPLQLDINSSCPLVAKKKKNKQKQKEDAS